MFTLENTMNANSIGLPMQSRTRVVIAAVLLIIFAIAVPSVAIAKWYDTLLALLGIYLSLQAQLDDLNKRLDDAIANRTGAWNQLESAKDTEKSRLSALEAAEARMKTLRAELKKRQEAVDSQRQAVNSILSEINKIYAGLSSSSQLSDLEQRLEEAKDELSRREQSRDLQQNTVNDYERHTLTPAIIEHSRAVSAVNYAQTLYDTADYTYQNIKAEVASLRTSLNKADDAIKQHEANGPEDENGDD